MNSKTELMPIDSVNAVELFTGGKLDDLLARIREEATTLVPDVSTTAGRKEIASVAYKVSRSKTTIDEAGKVLVSGWKAKAKEVDGWRKKSRDTLDALREEVRAPLYEWEAEQARIEEEKRIEAERVQAEVERIEREKVEAEELQRAEAEAARIADLERRESAMRAKEQAIADAERESADKVRRESADRERAVLEKAEIEKKANAKRAADRDHMKSINNEALSALTDGGLSEDISRRVITLIASGRVPHVSILY